MLKSKRRVMISSEETETFIFVIRTYTCIFTLSGWACCLCFNRFCVLSFVIFSFFISFFFCIDLIFLININGFYLTVILFSFQELFVTLKQLRSPTAALGSQKGHIQTRPGSLGSPPSSNISFKHLS